MTNKTLPIVALSELVNGQEADFFALLAHKEESTTRDGKPYFKITFRDFAREVSFPIWQDSAWGAECRTDWKPGVFYKLRATYKDSSFGPQLEIRKIREVIEADAVDGFDPMMCLQQTRFDPHAMLEELLTIANHRIENFTLRSLVVDLLQSHRDDLLRLPAATRNHHAFVGGYLEHVLSVTRTTVMLMDKYDDYYPDMQPRLNKDVAVAGAILHDIGKLQEIEQGTQGAAYTAAGTLIGHILQGRDIVREAAAGRDLDSETLLRLEHVIVSHQRLPEWGSPKPPMTPEALIVHYADDLDAKFHMMYVALRDAPAVSGPMTSKKNQLYQQVFRGNSGGVK